MDTSLVLPSDHLRIGWKRAEGHTQPQNKASHYLYTELPFLNVNINQLL